MSKFWTWIDGHKTTIGNGLIAIAAHIPSEVVIPYIEVPLNVLLYTIGGSFTGVGLSHKAKKKFSP
jgi:hypothetical protein